MQVLVAGSKEFISEWVAAKMQIVGSILEGLRGLSSRHVALYLLRQAGDGCRIVYYLRTTPRDMIEEFIQTFDADLRDTFQSIVGLVLDDRQWEQASYSVKRSGLGLCRAADIADAAYLASRHATFDECLTVDLLHEWDDGVPRMGEDEPIGEWLSGCIGRVNATIPEQSKFELGVRPTVTIKQGLVMELVNAKRRDAMVESSNSWDRARLEATAASHAGAWVEAPPNRATDTLLSNAEVQYGVGRRLGVEICEECACPFCWELWTVLGHTVSLVWLAGTRQ